VVAAAVFSLALLEQVALGAVEMLAQMGEQPQ
jgi:hypothetical protein